MELTTKFHGVVALLLVTMALDSTLAAEWSYEGEKGPDLWHELFPQACSGKYQSPIDIKSEQTMYNPSLKDFAIWYDPPRPGSTMTVVNNGHTLQVVTQGEFYVANGGLPYVYKTAQFHFHWGHAKHHGSEHLIDGKAYPLELHIVNYNSDLYDDIGAAVAESQGLAVLGVMFEEGEEDSVDLEPLIAAMEQVKDPEDGHQVELTPLSLRDLLPDDINSYFRYNGSLTTPGCFESVVWTVFAKPKLVSSRQMRRFREMLQSRHRGHHNGRHRRSLPLEPSARRRERRALQVLDELALTSEQQYRFRRDLVAKKEHAEILIDENEAGQAHHKMMEAVHDEGTASHDADHISEVELEYIQEKLVNNFRPVQPLNGRLVYRSFKLSEPSEDHKPHVVYEESDADRARRMEEAQERLKYYESIDNGASSTFVMSMSALLVSCFLSLFL